ELCGEPVARACPSAALRHAVRPKAPAHQLTPPQYSLDARRAVAPLVVKTILQLLSCRSLRDASSNVRCSSFGGSGSYALVVLSEPSHLVLSCWAKQPPQKNRAGLLATGGEALESGSGEPR